MDTRWVLHIESIRDRVCSFLLLVVIPLPLNVAAVLLVDRQYWAYGTNQWRIEWIHWALKRFPAISRLLPTAAPLSECISLLAALDRCTRTPRVRHDGRFAWLELPWPREPLHRIDPGQVQVLVHFWCDDVLVFSSVAPFSPLSEFSYTYPPDSRHNPTNTHTVPLTSKDCSWTFVTPRILPWLNPQDFAHESDHGTIDEVPSFTRLVDWPSARPFLEEAQAACLRADLPMMRAEVLFVRHGHDGGTRRPVAAACLVHQSLPLRISEQFEIGLGELSDPDRHECDLRLDKERRLVTWTVQSVESEFCANPAEFPEYDPEAEDDEDGSQEGAMITTSDGIRMRARYGHMNLDSWLSLRLRLETDVSIPGDEQRHRVTAAGLELVYQLEERDQPQASGAKAFGVTLGRLSWAS
eukprot:TRINITY_DN68924_c0_g1_i1.p1 TRINITY_DN68924_c0_g1~~TRINITY_DN68924_c0_g1_i1.p1  ORF type:complete len:411 (+),score=41.26 TRINITY_DN68924_c0_g1_i1:79-1311(+)